MLPALAQTTITTGGAFAVLSFLAAPAILTNASTILALGTSNRLARASDRARAASAAIVGSKGPTDDSLLKFYQRDFASATRRAGLLITALRRFYLAAGCFATGTCVALLGAFAEYFHVPVLPLAAQIATIALAITGVGGLSHGSLTLLRGPDGPLLPAPGRYTVRVELRVFLRRRYYLFTASTKITVAPFEDDKQRRIATLLLDTRQTLLTLAVGGDGLTDGNQAVNLALSHPILGPHYQIVRLKRLVRGIGRVRGYLGEALAILCATGPKAPVLTPTELISLVRLIRPGPAGANEDEAEEATVPFTQYLIADLRQVAVRLVLGRLNDKTIQVFLGLVRHQTKEAIGRKTGPTPDNPPGVPSSQARSILEGILRLQVGLSRSDSRELSELLYAGDHSVWSAMLDELDKPAASNWQRIRSAAAGVGFPLPDFTAAVKRFRQASDSQPDWLPPSELREFASELLRSLKDSPFASSDLNEVFRENLEHNLVDAGLLEASHVKSKPLTATSST